MANPFPFTAGQVLTAAQLNGIGEAGVAYTPTWTNLTVGNAVQDFKYVQINKLVYVRGSIVLGTTSSVGTAPRFTFPLTAAAYPGQMYLGNTYLLDSGTAAIRGAVVYFSTTAAEIGYNTLYTGTLTAQALPTATAPWTWTTNDAIRVEFVYEVA